MCKNSDGSFIWTVLDCGVWIENWLGTEAVIMDLRTYQVDCCGHYMGQEIECTGHYRLQWGKSGIETNWLAGIWTARQLRLFTVLATSTMQFLAPLLRRHRCFSYDTGTRNVGCVATLLEVSSCLPKEGGFLNTLLQGMLIPQTLEIEVLGLLNWVFI
jgi:hypothetical protein